MLLTRSLAQVETPVVGELVRPVVVPEVAAARHPVSQGALGRRTPEQDRATTKVRPGGLQGQSLVARTGIIATITGGKRRRWTG